MCQTSVLAATTADEVMYRLGMSQRDACLRHPVIIGVKREGDNGQR